MSSPYESSRNLAFLASSPIPRQNRELVIEFCYILSDLEPFQEKSLGSSLCTFIQRYKANVLYRQSFSNFVPIRYLKAIKADPSALKLYEEEQKLIKEGPQAIGDGRLEELSGDMLEHPTLKPLLDHRHRTLSVVPKDFHSLAAIARLTQAPTSNLILIDWMKYHDYFLITGYNVTEQKICILELIPDCKVVTSETWVKKKLKVDGKQLPVTLDLADVFKPLWPLVRAIHESCSKEDLLVFSPSQELHSIPLHALPYAGIDDRPVIDFHPIVYTPSNIILKECILRVIEDGTAPPLTASLFGRWGAENVNAAMEEQNIKDSLQNISTQLETINVASNIVSGASLTHSAFSTNMSKADILHFHTHVNETGIKQHLSLEPEIETTMIDNFQRVSNSLNPFIHLAPKPRTNTYNLQDAFATQIRARLVVMMGCRSGQQHISSSDDALGLISAFFAAGATSIVATLWQFETSDASKFSAQLYREVFVQQKEKALIEVAGAFRRSVMEMRACQKPICRKRRGLEERLNCHVSQEQGRPYNWASFVLWGSWVMGGSGEEGGVNEEVREELLGGGVREGNDVGGELADSQGKGKEREVDGQDEFELSTDDFDANCRTQ
jgi:CHAT domain-containing protein